ncbi:hypothetical protein H9P43_006524 [Blastocladiella emersonii ATCC 22665]|nr:hypothetical protein H9P43_006524 [Blastocladiella emersonii ATCC 22665]
MQLTVQFNGKSFATEAQPSDTVGALKAQVQAKEGVTVSNQKLTFGGAELADESVTLASAGLVDGATVVVEARAAAPSSATPTPAAPKKSATRCNLPGCSDKIARIVGDCRHCSSKFCSRHRLPEAHQCGNLDSCRKASHDQLAGKLMGEKCVATKV